MSPNVARPGRGQARTGCLVALLAAFSGLAGCDSGGTGPSLPSELDVQLSKGAVQVTRTITATAVGIGRQDRVAVRWLVDGVEGGVESTGTITQTNPATYTAPASVPAAGSVVIEARLAWDASVSAADTLAVLFTMLYVDAEDGDDAIATGAWAVPFRTVTAALGTAVAGDTVLLRPGTYDPALGEDPPHCVPPGVTLRGTHCDSCVLFGRGDRGNVVNLEDGAAIEHLTIRNADSDVIAIDTSSGGRIQRIIVTEPFAYAAIRSSNGSDVLIEDCRLENTERPLTGRGMELIWVCHATVRRCTLRHWDQGAFVNSASDPLIEYSVLEDNVFGIDTYETTEQLTEPDLGGGPRGSLGGNVIRGNASCGLASRTPGTIYAINNTWNVPPSEPPVYCLSVGDSCDICTTNGGTVHWCERASE